MTTPVYIGLGGNLGDRAATLDAAVAALAATPGVTVRAVSPYHETRPVGGPPAQGAFLNAAARLDTELGPRELLAATQGVEDRAGRVRTVRWGERTLDLDLLIFGDQFLDAPELRLPHPRLALRRFVLAPLAEIAPEVVEVVTGRTVADLLANLDREPRRLALVGESDGLKAAVRRRLVEGLPVPEDNPEKRPPPARWIVTEHGPDLFHGARQGVDPTYAAILDFNSGPARRPGFAAFPTLWPDPADLDAIVADLLATCRGIAGL